MSLYNILIEAHSGIRWLVLLLGLVSLIWLLIVWVGKKRWKKGTGVVLKSTVGLLDLQFLLGVSLLVNRLVNDLGLQRVHYEHAAINLIAIILAHVAGKGNALPDILRARRSFLYLLGSMLLIAVAISMLANGWQM